MADEKLNTGPAENTSPEAAEPITTPEQAAASEPQQEQTGPAIPEPGDVVVSFDKINELKSVQSLHTFPDKKPEVYNRTSTSGGKVFSRLPQPVIATTRNIEHGSHNPITNRITRLRSNIEHGRRSPLVILKRRGQRDGTFFTPPVQMCPAGSRRPVPAGRGTTRR